MHGLSNPSQQLSGAAIVSSQPRSVPASPACSGIAVKGFLTAPPSDPRSSIVARPPAASQPGAARAPLQGAKVSGAPVKVPASDLLALSVLNAAANNATVAGEVPEADFVALANAITNNTGQDKTLGLEIVANLAVRKDAIGKRATELLTKHSVVKAKEQIQAQWASAAWAHRTGLDMSSKSGDGLRVTVSSKPPELEAPLVFHQVPAGLEGPPLPESVDGDHEIAALLGENLKTELVSGDKGAPRARAIPVAAPKKNAPDSSGIGRPAAGTAKGGGKDTRPRQFKDGHDWTGLERFVEGSRGKPPPGSKSDKPVWRCETHHIHDALMAELAIESSDTLNVKLEPLPSRFKVRERRQAVQERARARAQEISVATAKLDSAISKMSPHGMQIFFALSNLQKHRHLANDEALANYLNGKRVGMAVELFSAIGVQFIGRVQLPLLEAANAESETARQNALGELQGIVDSRVKQIDGWVANLQLALDASKGARLGAATRQEIKTMIEQLNRLKDLWQAPDALPAKLKEVLELAT
jgi:hypothetical protein